MRDERLPHTRTRSHTGAISIRKYKICSAECFSKLLWRCAHVEGRSHRSEADGVFGRTGSPRAICVHSCTGQCAVYPPSPCLPQIQGFGQGGPIPKEKVSSRGKAKAPHTRCGFSFSVQFLRL